MENATDTIGKEAIKPASLEGLTKDWLRSKLTAIEEIADKDVVSICGPIVPGVDIRVRMAIGGMDKKRETLLCILHTLGGVVEEVRNIVQVIRNHYKYVHFLIPIHAMSAGTVLAMSGDKIYMDYFSRLGPIDPQILKNNKESFVPGLSYLHQYERMKEKSKSEPLTFPELILLEKLDLAELHQLELAADLSVSLIKDWLTKYKFKDWEKNGKPVPEKDRRARAEQIAVSLNDHQRWYTHGNSIHKDILEKDLKLQIDDYGDEKDLFDAVWEYFSVLLEYTGGGISLPFIHGKEYI